MTVPENMAEGLTLAGSGMALVFVALIVFMIILMGLQKLFPGEEMVMEMPEPEEPVEAAEPLQAVAEPAEAAPAPEPIPIAGSLDDGRISGAQIAAMAVAIYLEMEREDQARIAVAESPEPALVSAAAPDPDPDPAPAPQVRSGWGALGRATFLESQGRRAPSYNHRPQSPFNPRGRDVR